jgi:hypothetical protein
MNNSDDEREKEQKDKEKQARMEASLREREKEVQRTLATHLRDRDKEREQHKHDEAVQHFNALLADLVSGTTFTELNHIYILYTAGLPRLQACTLRFCLPMEEFLYGHLHCSVVSSYLWLCSHIIHQSLHQHTHLIQILCDAECTAFFSQFSEVIVVVLSTVLTCNFSSHVLIVSRRVDVDADGEHRH